MLLMYNRTYAAEIGNFPTWGGDVDSSFCRGGKETLGDCREGEKTWCCGYEWQCALGKGRVKLLGPRRLLWDVAFVGLLRKFTIYLKRLLNSVAMLATALVFQYLLWYADNEYESSSVLQWVRSRLFRLLLPTIVHSVQLASRNSLLPFLAICGLQHHLKLHAHRPRS